MWTLFLVAVACSAFLTALAAPTGNAPIIKYAGPIKPNSYVVKLKDNVPKEFHITKLPFHTDSKIVYKYERAFHGYAVEIGGQDLNFVRQSDEVEYIIEDGIVGLEIDLSEEVGEIKPSVMYKDQAHMSMRTDGGAGVDIYSLDSGIQINHTCFGGRARWGKTFGGYADADNYGHGTHTAATAVGDTYGIATAANIIAVKGTNRPVSCCYEYDK
ncbi:peptidase inhibitor i9 [Rhizoctonia solani 123E]|uniref:Peptidase inhibitor i9 n=1 Tax=Rhizoctonia solani 123E TaxID=1423351 RepID=A0A074RSF9_9AGAM|nr:peptidase inhibitor i9 [Rhizoctonia solani 123E]